MNFEQLQQMWEQDSKINEIEIDTASRKIPELHAKYMKYFSDYCYKRKEAECRLKMLKREKFIYYSGKATPDVYAENPFPMKLLKSDVNVFIEGDEEINKLLLKLESIQIVINYLENVLKMINNRSFQIKNVIEWKKFIDGVV